MKRKTRGLFLSEINRCNVHSFNVGINLNKFFFAKRWGRLWVLLQYTFGKSLLICWIWTFLPYFAKETGENQWISATLNPLCPDKVPHLTSIFRWKKDKFYIPRRNKTNQQTLTASKHTFWIYLQWLSLPFKADWVEVNPCTLIVHGSE